MSPRGQQADRHFCTKYTVFTSPVSTQPLVIPPSLSPQGQWAIGIFRGRSPFELQPLELLDRPRRSNTPAAWPVSNPVFTCAHVHGEGQRSAFVADPFIWPMPDGIRPTLFKYCTLPPTHRLPLADGDPAVRNPGHSHSITIPTLPSPFISQTVYLLYETKTVQDQQGDIGAAVSTDGGLSFEHIGIVLDEPWHLSYPYLIQDGEQVWGVKTVGKGMKAAERGGPMLKAVGSVVPMPHTGVAVEGRLPCLRLSCLFEGKLQRGGARVLFCPLGCEAPCPTSSSQGRCVCERPEPPPLPPFSPLPLPLPCRCT